MAKGSFMKIGILRGGALGDVVVTTPALSLLQMEFPEAKVTLIGEPYSLPVLERTDLVDQIAAVDSKESTFLAYIRSLRHLAKFDFDLLIDFHSTGRSRMQTLLIGGKERLGFEKDTFRNRFYTMVGPYRKDVHAVARLAGLLEPLGIDTRESRLELQLPVTDVHRKTATRLLLDHSVNGPYVVLHPSTGWRPEYRIWPVDRFAAVADALHAMGYQVIMTSRSEEEGPAAKVKALAHSPVINLAGDTHALVLAALLEGSQMYVGYNTGPMHIAAAVRTPIVGLFDIPHDAIEWHPWSAAPWRIIQARDVQPATEKAPAWRMDSVQTDEVIAAIHEVDSAHRVAVKG